MKRLRLTTSAKGGAFEITRKGSTVLKENNKKEIEAENFV